MAICLSLLAAILLLHFTIVASNQCANNCSSTSVIKGQSSPISCSIFNNVSSCPLLSDTGSVSMPSSVTIKLIKGMPHPAINITWKPGLDFSFNELRFYLLNISKQGPKTLPSVTTKVFCVNNKMDYFNHSNVLFHYACYGTSRYTRIGPGDIINVTITSFPHSLHRDASSSRAVQFPNCTDKLMKQFHTCFEVTVLKTDCNNRTFIFAYNVPSSLGKVANLLVSGYGQGFDQKMVNLLNQEVPLSSDKYSVTVPDTIQLDKAIKIELYGDSDLSNKAFADVMFEKCDNSQLSLIVGLTFAAAVSIVIFLLALYFIKRRLKGKESLTSHQLRNDTQNSQPNVIYDAQNYALTEPCKKLYLAFVNDHPKHLEVVQAFASFLHQDLGFEVMFELWQQDDIYKDKSAWIENAINSPDKSIFVWSLGAKARWDKYSHTDCEKQDLFTPVLKQVKKDLFLEKNTGKYCSVYFNYCSEADVPFVFGEKSMCKFSLMSQLKGLYCHLMDISPDQPGKDVLLKKVEPSKCFNPNVTKFGATLKNLISEMTAIVKKEPDWFQREKTQTVLEHNEEIKNIPKNMFEVAPSPAIQEEEDDLESNTDLNICQNRQTLSQIPNTIQQNRVHSNFKEENSQHFHQNPERSVEVWNGDVPRNMSQERIQTSIELDASQNQENIPQLDKIIQHNPVNKCYTHNSQDIQKTFPPRTVTAGGAFVQSYTSLGSTDDFNTLDISTDSKLTLDGEMPIMNHARSVANTSSEMPQSTFNLVEISALTESGTSHMCHTPQSSTEDFNTLDISTDSKLTFDREVPIKNHARSVANTSSEMPQSTFNLVEISALTESGTSHMCHTPQSSTEDFNTLDISTDSKLTFDREVPIKNHARSVANTSSNMPESTFESVEISALTETPVCHSEDVLGGTNDSFQSLEISRCSEQTVSGLSTASTSQQPKPKPNPPRIPCENQVEPLRHQMAPPVHIIGPSGAANALFCMHNPIEDDASIHASSFHFNDDGVCI